MGKLECMYPEPHNTRSNSANTMVVAGYIPVHALRWFASEAWNPYIKSQIFEYGLMDK